jgi:hypothetical protein
MRVQQHPVSSPVYQGISIPSLPLLPRLPREKHPKTPGGWGSEGFLLVDAKPRGFGYIGTGEKLRFNNMRDAGIVFLDEKVVRSLHSADRNYMHKRECPLPTYKGQAISLPRRLLDALFSMLHSMSLKSLAPSTSHTLLESRKPIVTVFLNWSQTTCMKLCSPCDSGFGSGPLA